MIPYGKHRFPGKLFVVEGTDGSGKSTQLALLHQWLKAEGYPVFYSEWNSSSLVKDTTRRAKKRRLFTPATCSMRLISQTGRNEILFRPAKRAPSCSRIAISTRRSRAT